MRITPPARRAEEEEALFRILEMCPSVTRDLSAQEDIQNKRPAAAGAMHSGHQQRSEYIL